MGMFNGASLSIILLVLTNDPIVVVGVDVIQLLLLVLISFFFDPLPFPPARYCTFPGFTSAWETRAADKKSASTSST